MFFSVQKTYKALCINDKQVRLVGYPLAGLIIPVIFFSWDLNNGWVNYLISALISLIYTIFYWEGNRQIITYFRLKYPLYKQVARRLIWQVIWVTLYSLVVAVVLHNIFVFFENLFASEFHKTRPYSMGHGIFVGLFITYICILVYECIYFFQRWKQSVIEAERLKLKNVETQLESLKHQVNPHFLFNSLNTLTSLIPKNPNEAIEFVQKLSEVYRYVLDVNAAQLIPLNQELEFAEAYLFLLQTRHGDSLKVHLNIDPVYQDHLVAPLVLQILIENAVKHNVVSSKYPLHVAIEVRGDKLMVTNPIRLKSQPFASTGLGLQNIRNRYFLLAQEAVETTVSSTHFQVSVPLISPLHSPLITATTPV